MASKVCDYVPYIHCKFARLPPNIDLCVWFEVHCDQYLKKNESNVLQQEEHSHAMPLLKFQSI